MTITSALLYRLSGFALVAALAFNLAGGMLHPVDEDGGHSIGALSTHSVPYPQYLILVGSILLMLGLPGMYAWVSRKAGLAGLISFVGFFVASTVMAMAHLAVEAFIAVPLAGTPAGEGVLSGTDTIIATTPFAALMIVAGLGLMLGMVVFGVALLRSGAVPRWISAVMIAGGLILLAPIPYAPVLSGLVIELPRGVAFAAIGVLMIRATRSTRNVTAAEPVGTPESVR
ncbi:hypothetical protein ACFYVR_12230 [Rhodococcus sp. NPDC003318]|uniref:hypothetical protein n=1 Tax=Rhodococcus sp. NPDC003318 TaxID=3364503 RepID=UPI0036A951D6